MLPCLFTPLLKNELKVFDVLFAQLPVVEERVDLGFRWVLPAVGRVVDVVLDQPVDFLDLKLQLVPILFRFVSLIELLKAIEVVHRQDLVDEVLVEREVNRLITISLERLSQKLPVLAYILAQKQGIALLEEVVLVVLRLLMLAELGEEDVYPWEIVFVRFDEIAVRESQGLQDLAHVLNLERVAPCGVVERYHLDK